MAENADDTELEDLSRKRETQQAAEEEETTVIKAFSLSTVRNRFLQGWTPMVRRHPKSQM